MKKMLLVLIMILAFELKAQLEYQSFDSTYSMTFSLHSDSIYKGHNYEYYAEIYKKATTIQRTGIGLTSAGASLFIVGAILIINSDDINDSDRKAGDILSISGFITLNAGIPLWIAGGRMRINNRNAMEHLERRAELSFGVTNNGVGFVLNF